MPETRTGEACPKCGNDKLVFRISPNAHPRFASVRTCRACGELFAVPEPAPALPPTERTAGMSDETLADIRALCGAMPPGGMFSDPLRALLREVERTRADAALGAALRAALATVPDDEALVIRVRGGESRVSIPNGDVSDATIWNDATRALAAALLRASPRADDPKTETRE